MRGLEDDRLFPPRKLNGKVDYLDLRAPWENALRVAGISEFHWHDLRHTAASYLAMSGASVVEIADILGHKQLSMVRRYAHLSESHCTEVLKRMNERILGDENRDL